MHLFDTILETHNPFVIHNLLLRNYTANIHDIDKEDTPGDYRYKKQQAAWLVGRYIARLFFDKLCT
jgi:hypothetical protein